MVSFKKIAPVVFLVFFLSAVYAFNVGVSPNSLDLGEVEAGETVEAYIYVWSDEDGTVVVEPEYRNGIGRFIHREDSMPFVLNELSEEDTTGYVSWGQEEYAVDPETEVESAGGGTYEERMVMELNIPNDAEPGYRLGFVDISLDTPEGGEGAQIGIYSVPEIPVVYEVDSGGTPVRSLDVQEVRTRRASNDQVRLDFLVQNTGTVTTSLRSSDINIQDTSSGERDSISLSGQRIAPGETEIIAVHWDDDSGIEAGEYQLDGEIGYMTGRSFFDTTINIGDIVEIREGQEPDDPDDPQPDSPPYMLVLMVLLVLGVMMYAFDVDPLYIMAGVGAIGISTLIWFWGLPLYLAALVIITTVVMLYYGN